MSEIKASVQGNRVITGEVRLSYVHLLEPKESRNGQLRYSTSVLVDKSDTDTIQAIQQAAKNAIAQQKDKRWGGVVPKKIHNAMIDADNQENQEGEIYSDKYPEQKGKYTLQPWSKDPVSVVNAGMREASADEVYSGVYARVALHAFLYNVDGKKGISYSLDAVQIIRDGEPLGGAVKVKAENVFSAIPGMGFGEETSDATEASDDELSSLLD